jgi:DNA segregation ATPase FtsK/SpoIIIE, S-DNA-T family
VDDKEVDKVVSFLKSQGEPAYIDDITKEDEAAMGAEGGNSGDSLYDQAVSIVLRDRKASTSYVQRQLKIGYNRAANLIEEMEKQGVVSSPGHTGKREVLVN